MNTRIILLTILSLFFFTVCSKAETTSGNIDKSIENQKILIVYFSHTGNTKIIANYIHNAVKSHIVEIKTIDQYTNDYDLLLSQIRQEVATNYSPPISTKIDNFNDYDVIFIGYPIWVETVAPPIRTFLSTNDLTGKTIISFCTSGTSSATKSYQFVRSLCPQSTFFEGIQIHRGTYDTANNRVLEWLRKIKIITANN